MSGTAPAFDTLRYANQLIDGGFSRKQAEALAEAQVATLNANLATKADIAQIQLEIETLRQETKKEIEVLRQEIEAAKFSLVKWMFGALAAQTALLGLIFAIFSLTS